MQSGLLLSLLLTIGQAVETQPTSRPVDTPSVIPRPARIQSAPGEFQNHEGSLLFVDPDTPEARAVADYLAEHLNRALLYPVKVSAMAESPPPGSIYLHARDAFRAIGDEGYELHVSPESCSLKAKTPRGLFLGAQSIRQLLPAEKGPGLPCVHITDMPRYRHRGMLLDCGRHFMPKDFVKRYIDLLAYHKMNVLHWHLTEDQGWRIEVKEYPKLTEVGAWRRATRDSEQPRDTQGRYGGFYTQDEVREIVAYAKSRYVTVIPEIEMPGHSLAALASYPELSCTGGPFEVRTEWGIEENVYCAGNDRTFEFLQDVLTEVMELFPSEYIHIGGDECPKTRWKACAKCQERIKAEGLKDEHELQSWFIRRIEKFLNAKGRRLIGWDEILEGGLAPNATVQSWRGMAGAIAAATSGHDVIASPTTHCYLDYAQGLNPAEPTFMGFVSLEKAYQFEPTPPELTAEQAKHVLGVQGNMWTEHAPPELVDRQVFPRLCALAEVGWSPKEARDWEDFSRRMKRHYQRLDELGVRYYIPPPQFSTGGKPVTDPSFTETFKLVLGNAFHDGTIHYTLDGSEPTAESLRYHEPLTLNETTTVKARTSLAGGHAGVIGEVRFRKLQPNEPIAGTGTGGSLRCSYYEGHWSSLPDFSKMTPAATSDVQTIDLLPRKRDEWYGLRFDGLFEAAVEGVYTFYVTADDGARLRIGATDPCDLDVRWDRGEAATRVWLRPGRHPFQLDYFQKGGSARLEVSYKGPGTPRQSLPPSAFSYTPSGEVQ